MGTVVLIILINVPDNEELTNESRESHFESKIKIDMNTNDQFEYH